ncbi:triacylglycerol lipase 1 [Telopea speciosissima]|uniref:triacylglycerol lipase 1 n=1 Tax=Telopea speciosissima TaxID=54955 RepID=UPI001CC454CA|nr:triacylglycerol lipase 1 [Telopea speciosissima]
MGIVVDMAASLCWMLVVFAGVVRCSPEQWNLRRSQSEGLCAQLIQPSGYPCSEHTVQTKDGYVLALQRVSAQAGGDIKVNRGPPILLQHGLFLGGDIWFANSIQQSLGFILADHGFDVWVGNVRGTHWSRGHVSFSEKDKEFWDWSWQELALYDLVEMITYVYSITNSKIFYVGHSQGTIMALAAFTQPDIVEMVEAAALLCPISYLGHISAQFVLSMVSMHLDQMLLAMGIHQLNFRSDMGVQLMDSFCDGRIDCGNLLSSITGKNCCFNESRVDFYLEYEPHPSSSKNLNHLFQMIRKGTFAKYDYGWRENLKQYGYLQPPAFDLGRIPKSLPLWMGYGGNDALADVMDVEHTLKELQSKPELLYLDNYGHIDFILSVTAREDVYNNMIAFFRSYGKSSSS